MVNVSLLFPSISSLFDTFKLIKCTYCIKIIQSVAVSPLQLNKEATTTDNLDLKHQFNKILSLQLVDLCVAEQHNLIFG